ncbi:hypothetical protein AB0D94_22705 [Streptomyces sp. NPDC048255]|uniref:hypothetical protein n=1 Tax=Streptomyces sp. NPDC048255 TaxID=3154713 RepID=UPI0033F0F6FC
MAWTGGKVDLPNEEIERKSDQELASAPLTGPLLVIVDPHNPFFDLPDIEGSALRPVPGRAGLQYAFISRDPSEKYPFAAAYRYPDDGVERDRVDGKVLSDPESGVRTEKSDTGVQKINAHGTARISPVGTDGKAGLELSISADLFSWHGVSIIGAWGRADQARVIGVGTLRKPDGRGEYLSDANCLEHLRDEATVGGYFGTTLKFKERLTPGQSYVLDWTCTRPWDDGTRDRQDGVSVSGRLSFSV